LTRSERDAAVARANARREVIENARRAFDSLPQFQQSALRASYERAEHDAVEVVEARRAEAPSGS
jgi:hypothetical protein